MLNNRSWWRLIALQSGADGGKGSWARRAAVALGVTPVAKRPWEHSITKAVGVQGDQGSWAKRAVDPANLIDMAAVERSIYEQGGFGINDILLSNSTIDENAAQGTAIGTLSANGGTGPYTFTLTNDAGGKVQLTGADAIEAGATAIDYEATPTFDIAVHVVDANAHALTKTLTITVGNVAEAPTDMTLSNAAVDEDAALGFVIGTVSFTGGLGSPTLSIVDDAGGLFDVTGNSLIVSGVLDYETATSHNITLRATSLGETFDKVFTITVNDVAETPAANPPPTDGTVVSDDPTGFTDPPVVVDVDGGIKFAGKKRNNGSSGKFIYDIGPPLAGHTYIIEYDPDWSLLANDGVTAMVAFGFKHGNDFHLAGLKGDGAAGLNKEQIYGANWTQTSGFTENDGGGAAHGTQDGPNWLRLDIAADGATYILSSSADGNTWTPEFVGQTPTPLTNATDATTFGIAVFLDADDAGSFSVKISFWTAALTPLVRLSQQYAEVITSGSANKVRLSQQYAEVITAGSDNKVRLSQQYAEVIHESTF